MTVSRILVTWALLAVAMTINGIFRETVLRGAAPDAITDALSALIGATIILGITWVQFRHAARLAESIRLVASAATLLTLTVGFEFAVGRLVDHKSWTELFANYAFWQGKLWPGLLLIVGASPFIWGRWLGPARHTQFREITGAVR